VLNVLGSTEPGSTEPDMPSVPSVSEGQSMSSSSHHSPPRDDTDLTTAPQATVTTG